MLAQGATVGLVTGLVGAGGGFVVVPALVLLGGMAMPEAVGTSLLVLVMQTTAGFVGHLHAGGVDWHLALAVTGLAVVGVLIGGRLAGRVKAQVLRLAFGWFVVAMAGLVLVEQLPAAVRALLLTPAVAIPVAVVAAAGAATGAATGLVRR